jgi:D-arabinose 1-dehydrogenase-like Zn-dependent alcohol dehydrogenase
LRYRILDHCRIEEPGSTAFVHVDLTELPTEFCDVTSRYPACINGNAVTIDRRLGQGTSGLLHTRLAVLGGAEVIGVSRSKWKLNMATRMGAGQVIAKGAGEAIDDVLRLTGGEGVGVVIDTAGGADALRIGIAMLKPGGRFLSFSLSNTPAEGFTAFPLYYKELTIIGSRGLVDEDMQPSIELVASGKIEVADFITAIYPLRETAAAFSRGDRLCRHPSSYPLAVMPNQNEVESVVHRGPPRMPSQALPRWQSL